MATLFLDFENGNDNYGGSSFALLAQGTNGRITTATFSSATASFPNDGSLIGQYLSIFNGSIYAVYNITAWVSSTSLTIAALSGGTALANQAVDRQYYIGGRWKNITTGATAVRTIPGDTIRIMGSPAPTSLGQNGVWTSQALQATKNIISSTNATPIAITCTAHGYSTGDTVVVTGHSGNTNANRTWEITNTGANTFTLDNSVGNGEGGANGTVRLRNNSRVKLTSAVTQSIASTGARSATWTPSANVTTEFFGTTKEGTSCDRINIASGFTTGLAAYYTLPSTLDLSGYQQVSFWIQQYFGAIGAAGAVRLCLCSDTVGTTIVNSINIPNLGATTRWMPVTVDLATNLGSSIRSIAFYVNTDNSLQEFLLSNIIACKASSAADSLTLTSLIGKNTTGETFWGIQSINGTRVMLDADTNAIPASTSVRGYYGTSETVTTWKRETIKLGPAASNSTALQTIQESGTDGSPITYSGGWDRTNMSIQDLETWLDGVNGNGYGIFYASSGATFVTLAKLALVRFTNAIFCDRDATGAVWDVIAANYCTGQAIYSLVGPGPEVRVNYSVANAGICIQVQGLSNVYINNFVGSNGGRAVSLNTSPGSKVVGTNSNARISNCQDSGIAFVFAGLIGDLIIADTGNTAIAAQSSAHWPGVTLLNCDIQPANEVSAVVGGFVFSQNHDRVANNHKIFTSGGLISSATDQRHTASGISWKIQPTSTTIRNSAVPLPLSLAKVACSANNLVTIKAWMYRDNSGLTMRLVCKGGQLAGVASDVVSALSTTNAWEEETITFTPTETGVVEITAEAWGGTTYSGWVDDMTISQA